MTSDCGIYQIEHTESGKKYVGSARRIKRRLSKHKTDLRAGAHHCQKLRRAWGKYGEPAFVFSVIEFAPEDSLLAREQHWIDLERVIATGYNLCPTAGSCRGRKLTTEHRAKLSAALTGRKRPLSDHEGLRGTKRSLETRGRISASKKGKPISAETLARRTETMYKAWVTRRANQALTHVSCV